MTARTTRVALSVLLLVGVTAVAACGEGSESTSATTPAPDPAADTSADTSAHSDSTESTRPAGVTVVRIGTEEHDNSHTAQLLALFADEAERASGGKVVVEATYGITRAHGGGVAWDQTAIQIVADGEFDGVVARAGAWHETGATSLDVLQLPELVDTDAQADALVANADAVDQVMSGLPAAGFTGLGLYPEGPRYLMLLDDTTDFSLAALAGRTIRAPLSRTVFDLLSSTGMEPMDLTAADFTVQVPEGTVTATEGHLARVEVTTTADGATDPAVAVNVPLYTKFLVLALRDGVLPDDVVDVLRDAARTVVPTYLAARATDVAAAESACSVGAVLIQVPAADRVAILDAARPVVDEFTAGPDGALVELVRSAAGEASPVELRCGS